MFGLAPKLPVTLVERQWVDSTFDEFAQMFGESFLKNVTPITPTPEFFSFDWDGSEESAEITLQRVCELMSVDRNRLALEFFDDKDELNEALGKEIPYYESQKSGAGGFYRPPDSEGMMMISLERGKLHHPVSMIATIAHELAHVILLGDGRITRDIEYMEPMTDLLTVYSGMGIFNANSAVNFQQHNRGWSMRRLGYLSEPQFGYALARFAFLRGEEKPAWAKHLNLNVGSYLRQSLKYLQREHRA
ncbi:hypothetical protein CCAX7_12500 [Capsulimonas corticalis]|uniref:Uncharacterized protein n=1 Tax=Capsulimonas corticalis TaxID=2219043 RepID=A0A402D486_9BACT|nr:hypothetical protein [Capsulimonas corticalis]BDI29199.1 hypothetical protein CCAX7_12500 [Capsulimonas corticalis]